MKRKTKIEDLLPKIRNGVGGIYKQKVVCNKKLCRCATGDKHEAYYYIRRVSGKLVKTHVPKSEVDEIRKILTIAKRKRERADGPKKDSKAMLRRFRDQLRQHESVILNIKREQNE